MQTPHINRKVGARHRFRCISLDNVKHAARKTLLSRKLDKGKTPELTAEEAGELPHSIETDTVVEPRDRALIGVMVFTLARDSAACSLNVAPLAKKCPVPPGQ